MSLTPKQLEALNGRLVYVTWAAGGERATFARIYYLTGKDHVILDHSFSLDPRDEHIAIGQLVAAQALLEVGIDAALPGYVSPQAAWELFRAIITAATLGPDRFVVDRLDRQDQVKIRTLDGIYGDLMFWRPSDAQDRSRVTWEVGDTWVLISSMTTTEAIKTVLYTDPSDRPSLGSSEVFTPPT